MRGHPWEKSLATSIFSESDESTWPKGTHRSNQFQPQKSTKFDITPGVTIIGFASLP
jgi:hypothetical protein